jgi:TPR repeat protein
MMPAGKDPSRLVVPLSIGGALLILLLVLSVWPSQIPQPKEMPAPDVSITITAADMKAAEDGNPDAQFAVATSMLADAELNLAYSAKAVELLQRAAEGGHTRAMLSLGLLYRKGVGALQNFALAAKWIEAAAERGEPLAMLELGRLYREGVGVRKDTVRAYIWLNRAAAARNIDAVRERAEVARNLSAEELKQAQDESVVVEVPISSVPAT